MKVFVTAESTKKGKGGEATEKAAKQKAEGRRRNAESGPDKDRRDARGAKAEGVRLTGMDWKG